MRMIIGMMLLWMLFGQATPASAEGVSVLLDTKASAANDLNWRSWSNLSNADGWTEETLARGGTNTKVYRVCDTEFTDVENWLLVPRLDVEEAKVLHVSLDFRFYKCTEIHRSERGDCVETLKLYAAPLGQGEDLQEDWHTDPRWKQIDTIVARSDEAEIHVHTSDYTTTAPYLHFAIRDSGSCSAILSMKVHYTKEETPAPSPSPYSIILPAVGAFLLVLVVVLLFLICCRGGEKTYDEEANIGRESLVPDSPAPRTPAHAGQMSASRRKGNVPLLFPVGPVQRSPVGNKQFQPYVDPTAYEDPYEALSMSSIELPEHVIEVTRVIGSGEFGEVCCGRLTVTDTYGNSQQQIIAVKTLLPGKSRKDRDDFLTEASIMVQFEHMNVIRLIGVVTRTDPAMIVTEYMLNGSLDKFLSSNDGRIEVSQLVKMLHGIASGMQYLTEQKYYCHRDLAARNILVDDRLTCKISDFGLSRGMSTSVTSPVDKQYTESDHTKIPIKWTAPEAISSSNYTAFSDVWSYGVVMWEVFTFGRCPPYGDWPNRRVVEELNAGYRLPNPMVSPDGLYNLSPEHSTFLYSLMLNCWKEEAIKRPSFSSIVSQLKTFIAELECELNNANFGLKSNGLSLMH